MGHAATPSSECPPRTCYSVLEECVLSFLVREFFNATPAFASYNKVDVTQDIGEHHGGGRSCGSENERS
jgi:hypothetical protein